jgi:hypothetical protein
MKSCEGPKLASACCCSQGGWWSLTLTAWRASRHLMMFGEILDYSKNPSFLLKKEARLLKRG